MSGSEIDMGLYTNCWKKEDWDINKSDHLSCSRVYMNRGAEVECADVQLGVLYGQLQPGDMALWFVLPSGRAAVLVGAKGQWRWVSDARQSRFVGSLRSRQADSKLSAIDARQFVSGPPRSITSSSCQQPPYLLRIANHANLARLWRNSIGWAGGYLSFPRQSRGSWP